MKPEVELIYAGKSKLGEGPYWDESLEKLVWIDIEGCSINIFDIENKTNEKVSLNKMIGCIVPRENGGAVAALEDGFYFIDYSTKKLEFIVHPEKHIKENRFNDGKCDAQGRFWAGTMAKDQNSKHAKGAGNLYVLENNRDTALKVQNVTISNGIGWSPDNKNMYYVDTAEKKVVSYDYDLETGEISNKKFLIIIPENEGVPDGICVDARGMIWVAHWGGGQVSCWNPKTLECIEKYQIPTPNVTSCAFGGSEYNELFITTASVGLDKEEAESSFAGAVYRIKLETKGLPPFKFKG